MVAIWALLCMASACASSVAPLVIPRPGEVVSIDATISNSYNVDTKAYRGAVHVEDQAKISEILGRIRELNSGMTVPNGTFPTPTHAIVVSDKVNINLVVFIGLDWIGGRNIVPGKLAVNRARHISEAERASILKLVGIDDYRFK
jgi:hypothetical protein